MAKRFLILIVAFLTLSTVGWGDGGRAPASFKSNLASTQHALQTPASTQHLHELFMNVVSGTRKQMAPGTNNQAQLNFATRKPASVVMVMDESSTPALSSPARVIAVSSSPSGSAIPWATGPGATIPLK